MCLREGMSFHLLRLLPHFSLVRRTAHVTNIEIATSRSCGAHLVTTISVCFSSQSKGCAPGSPVDEG
eukprot:2049954-Rhodomonas_salina.1